MDEGRDSHPLTTHDGNAPASVGGECEAGLTGTDEIASPPIGVGQQGSGKRWLTMRWVSRMPTPHHLTRLHSLKNSISFTIA